MSVPLTETTLPLLDPPAPPACEAPTRRPRRSLPDDLAGERLIDKADFIRLLGVGSATFERWLAARRIPEPIRLSKTCHRWRRADVVAWIEAGCPAPVTAARAPKR